MLTDGANTQGVDPVTAAEQAAARHVRVYTIGFGTTEPAPLVCTPNQISSDSFGGGGFGGGGGGGGFGGGWRRWRPHVQDIDEDELQQVATITGGKYFQAKDAKALTDALMRPAQSYRPAAPAGGDHGVVRAGRRAARAGGGRPGPVVEPVKVRVNPAGNGLSSLDRLGRGPST